VYFDSQLAVFPAVVQMISATATLHIRSLVAKVKAKIEVSAGFHSRHSCDAATAVTAFRALGVYLGKNPTPSIQTRVVGSWLACWAS